MEAYRSRTAREKEERRQQLTDTGTAQNKQDRDLLGAVDGLLVTGRSNRRDRSGLGGLRGRSGGRHRSVGDSGR
jgi:hypothetical protein